MELTKDGYEFKGWYKNGEKFDFTKPVKTNITLTAEWEELTWEEVDYIESSGTQYIDTGVPANINLKVVADITPLANGYPFGVAPSQSVQYYGMALVSSNGNVQSYLGTAGSNGSYPIVSNLWEKDVRCTLIANDNKLFYYNGTLVADYTTTNNTLEFSSTPITIFALNGAYLSTRMSMKLYSFKMYDNGTLIKDFVPIKLSNGKYALLDKVNNQVYENKGTGEFGGGKIQEPVYLNYIQSTGSQYIDTGVIMTSSIYSVVDFQYVSLDTTIATAGLIGGWGGTGSSSGQLFGVVTANKAFQFAYGSGWNGSTMAFDTNRHTVYMNNAEGKCLLDDTVLATSSDVTVSITDTRSTHLFKSNGGASFSNSKIYSCQMYDNEILIRNFVPYRDEYGVVCLYDTVNSKKYYNAGTGEFIGG